MKAVVTPSLLHGAELFGMSSCRTRTGNSCLNYATLWSRASSGRCAREKLAIDELGSLATRARIRLFRKYASRSDTILGRLIMHPMVARGATWVSGTLRWVKRYLHLDLTDPSVRASTRCLLP